MRPREERILLTDVPDDYIQIGSGLGEATPLNIVVLPVLFEGEVKAVIELASFHRFSDIHLTFLDQLTESIGIVLNTIAATCAPRSCSSSRSRSPRSCRRQQQELHRDQHAAGAAGALAAGLRGAPQAAAGGAAADQRGARGEGRAARRAERARSSARTARSSGRAALEEKAEQLALTSKYKSEFLANMSPRAAHAAQQPAHPLEAAVARTPTATSPSKQVEFAQTIHASGTDLLALINDILDLSKIESGTMDVDVDAVPFDELQDYVERTFRQVAETRGSTSTIELGAGLPPTIHTDAKRLQQVLKNLLSNAFKFTEQGKVHLHDAASPPRAGAADIEALDARRSA